MSDETEAEEKQIVIEAATARDILAAFAPDHAFPDLMHDAEPEVRSHHVGGAVVEVLGLPISQQHGVADVNVINEVGAVITCCCGELVPFGPEDAEAAGWKADGVVKRLQLLCKENLARVGKGAQA